MGVEKVLLGGTLELAVFMMPNRPRGYKTFFVLNSVEHEILNTHKYEHIKKFSIFQDQNAIFPAHKCWHFNINERGKFHVALLFYVHGKHLRSCRDGQLT